jgi:transcriptional regulator with PAS, ATPase and Fis domain
MDDNNTFWPNEALKEAWKNHVSGRPFAEDILRPEIRDSWKRCRACGVDHNATSFPPPSLSSGQIKSLVFKKSSLITAARDVLNNFYYYINNMDVVIFLVDEDGYILYTTGEGPIWKYMNEATNVLVGNSVDESLVGTNAPFMALKLDKPYEMVAEEHYTQTLHACRCVAAPIHNENGRIIGCLDLTLTHQSALKHPHTFAMIIALAGMIEKQLGLVHSIEEAYFLGQSLQSAIAAMNDGLVVISGDNTIVHLNLAAERLLGIRLEEAAKKRVDEVIKSKIIIDAIDRREQFSDQEIVLDEPASRPRCLVSLNPIISSTKKHLGSTLLFKEYKVVQKLVQKVVGLKAHYTFNDIRGKSPQIKDVIRMANAVANSDSIIIITGESGTGKELIAQSVHNAGCRSEGPFLPINCAAIPYDLIESELFGYEAGTFTGGLRQGKPGKLELVKGGTLFLDEINGMSMDMQAKLLRVLEDRQFQRLGGNNYIPLDARIISATNQNLLERVNHGNFRSDLYYRLSVIEINIPGLRERTSDIEILVGHFIEEKNRQLGRSIQGISREAMDFLMSYSWPGNVRELKNWIERAVNLAHGDLLNIEDFSGLAVSIAKPPIMPAMKEESPEGRKLVDLFERDFIRKILEECEGNILKTAKRLAMSRATLYRKMEKYQITMSRSVRY